MRSITYVGLDAHKQSISYCVETAEGERTTGQSSTTCPPVSPPAAALGSHRRVALHSESAAGSDAGSTNRDDRRRKGRKDRLNKWYD